MEVISPTNVNNQQTQKVTTTNQKIIQLRQDSLKKILETKQANLKKSVLNNIQMDYKQTISSKVLEFFLDTYGTNFDVESLMDSLNFSKSADNLLLDFSYDSKKFSFSNDLSQNISAFNENAVQMTQFTSLLDSDEYMDYIQNDNEEKSLYEGIMQTVDSVQYTDNKQIFSPVNKMMRQGGFLTKDEAYKKATAYALQSFNEKYNDNYKKELEKKYNIKIGNN